jgi:hypothetical protein
MSELEEILHDLMSHWICDYSIIRLDSNLYIGIFEIDRDDFESLTEHLKHNGIEFICTPVVGVYKVNSDR